MHARKQAMSKLCMDTLYNAPTLHLLEALYLTCTMLMLDESNTHWYCRRRRHGSTT